MSESDTDGEVIITKDESNWIYFDFTKVSFHEFFEMDSDRWQMYNVYNALSASAKAAWAERVSKLFACRGAKCKMTYDDALHRP